MQNHSRNVFGLAVILAVASVGTGCKKSPCPSGAYIDPGGEFCVVPPADYHAQPEVKNGDEERYVQFVKGDPGALSNTSNEFTVSVQSLDMYDANESMFTHPYGTVVEQSDLKDGKFMHIANAPTKEQIVRSLVKGPTHSISCHGQNPDRSPHPEFVDACKSLVALPASK